MIRPAQASNSANVTHSLRGRIGRIADSAPYLRDDLGMLLKRTVDDRPMALVRARRIAEVVIYDFCHRNTIKIADKRGNPTLNTAIRSLAKTTYVTRVLVALCDAVRLEGNKCAHYRPKFGQDIKPLKIARTTVLDTLSRITEILELLLLRDDRGYARILPRPFDSMHLALRKRWRQILANKKEGVFPLLEALELLYRSIVRDLTPDLLTVLARYREQRALPNWLPLKEEEALRRLRNLGLIVHDGQWLFTPTRSTTIDLTPQGNFLLALMDNKSDGREEQLARNVIRQWNAVEEDEMMLKFLEAAQYDGELSSNDKTIARKSRNMHLIRHPTYFLEAATDVSLTDLGYYILGRHKPE